MWDMYTGERWNQIEKAQTTSKDSKPVKRYRLEVNDAAFACLTHAYTLFGEVSGDSDPLVRPLIQLKSQSSTIDTVKAQEFLDIVLG